MPLLTILLIWAVLSLTIGPLLGAFLRRGRRPGGYLA
jgi:hypothetical protein